MKNATLSKDSSSSPAVLYLTYKPEVIEGKLQKAKEHNLLENKRRIGGTRHYYLIDKKFIDLINYYRDNSSISFRGMKAILIRTALEEFEDFIKTIKPKKNNFWKDKYSMRKYSEWDMLIQSGGTRKRISSADNKRYNINIKTPLKADDFIKDLSIYYDHNDKFKSETTTTPKVQGSLGEYSFTLDDYYNNPKKFSKKKFFAYPRGPRVSVSPAHNFHYEEPKWGYASFIVNEALFYYFTGKYMYLG